MVERIIVHKHLYPALHQYPIPENIKDQFAFRPSGSTTAAIIDLLQQTSNMLLNNDCVVIVSTDFSKAFDTVSHQALFDKMGSLDLPDEIYNWTVSNYSNRSHVIRYLQPWALQQVLLTSMPASFRARGLPRTSIVVASTSIQNTNAT